MNLPRGVNWLRTWKSIPGEAIGGSAPLEAFPNKRHHYKQSRELMSRKKLSRYCAKPGFTADLADLENGCGFQSSCIEYMAERETAQLMPWLSMGTSRAE